jgi:hypothetical protein
MKNVLFFLFILFIVSACGSDENRQSDSSSLQMHAVDSVKIDFLGNLILQDVDEKLERVLFYNMSKNEMVLANFEGEILWEKSWEGDSPNSHGGLVSPAKFNGDQIFVIGRKGYTYYDINGNLLTQKALPANYRTFFTSFNQRGIAEEWRDKYYTVYFDRGSFQTNEAEYYTNLKVMGEFDPESEVLRTFVNFPAGSKFINGRAYEVPNMMPVYARVGQYIWMVFFSDTKLYKFDLNNDFELLETKALSHLSFYETKGVELSAKDPRAIIFTDNDGQNSILKTDGNYLLMGYVPGLNESDRDMRESLRVPDKKEELQAFEKQLAKRNVPSWIVYDLNGEKLSEFPNTLNMNFFHLIGKSGHFYTLRNPRTDEEEDFFMLYKLKIAE